VYVLLSTLNGNVEGDVFKVDGEVVESVTTTSFGMYMDMDSKNLVIGL